MLKYIFSPSLPYNSKPEYSTKSRGPGQGRAMWSARVGGKDKSSHHRLPTKNSSKLPSGEYSCQVSVLLFVINTMLKYSDKYEGNF